MTLKRKLIITFIAQAILIIILCFNDIRTPSAIPEPELSGSMIFDEQRGIYLTPEEQHPTQNAALLSLNYGKLTKGTYHGVINYDANDSTELVVTFSCSNASYLKANPLFLDPHLNKAHFDITLTQTINNFTISVNGSPDITLSMKIDLKHSRSGLFKSLIAVVVLFSVIESALICSKKKPKLLKTVVILLLAAFTAFIPYMLTGIKPGHDFTYHFMRIEGLANELRNGQFPVYMESMWIGDHGYPVSLYYSDIFLYFPAVLRLIGYSVDAAYKIFVFSVNLFTSIAAFVSFRKIFRKDKISYVLAFVYTCAPYRLVDIYVRSAVGEFCAISFLPLICAGFYGICVTEPPETGRKISAFISFILDLSFGMAGVFLSHILTTEMSLILLVILAVLFIRKLIKPVRMVSIILAAANTIIMSLIFLVPFIDFYLNNETEIKMGIERVIPAIQEQGIQPGELFLFTKDIFGGGANNGMEFRMYFSIGLTLMLSISAAVYEIFSKKRYGKLVLFAALSWLSIFLSSSLFPWDDLAHRTRIGVLFAQIQFPWRFLAFATLFSVLTLGALLEKYAAVFEPVSIRIFEKKEVLLTGLCFIISLLSFMEAAHIASSYASGRDRAEYLNTNEIHINSIPPYHILRHGNDPEYYIYDVSTENAAVENIQKNGTTWQLRCRTTDTSGTVTLPLNNYAGFKAIDEKGREFRIYDGENKTVSFILPANYEGNIEVAFHAPGYWKIAAVISAIWLLILILIGCKNRVNATCSVDSSLSQRKQVTFDSE